MWRNVFSKRDGANARGPNSSFGRKSQFTRGRDSKVLSGNPVNQWPACQRDILNSAGNKCDAFFRRMWILRFCGQNDRLTRSYGFWMDVHSRPIKWVLSFGYLKFDTFSENFGFLVSFFQIIYMFFLLDRCVNVTQKVNNKNEFSDFRRNFLIIFLQILSGSSVLWMKQISGKTCI